MTTNFNLQYNDWKYNLSQNSENGELKILSFERVGLVRKAVEYAKAEVSGLVGEVELPVLEARKTACDGCESVKKAGEEEWYCKSCGCPEWERSKLQVKWGMPAAKCPLGKWPVNG